MLARPDHEKIVRLRNTGEVNAWLATFPMGTAPAKGTRPNDPRAKEAISRYRTLESFREASLIEVQLTTGRRNQIRIQAGLRGYPLVGEQRYVFDPRPARPIPFGRQALHAFRLSFRHPDDDRPLTFESPIPSDMLDLLARLR